VKLSQPFESPFSSRAGALELRLQAVEEQRLDDPHDVSLASEVRSQRAPLRGGHYVLEEGAKDDRTNPGPLKPASVEQGATDARAASPRAQSLCEQRAVHIREFDQSGIQIR
jgi:hypothetical protein